MKAKAEIGKFYFGRYHNIWAVWVYEMVTEQGTRSSKVEACCTFEEALRKTYSLNGWKQPKYIARKF